MLIAHGVHTYSIYLDEETSDLFGYAEDRGRGAVERRRLDRRLPPLVGPHARPDAGQPGQQSESRAASARCFIIERPDGPGRRRLQSRSWECRSSGRVARAFVASFLVLFLEVALIRWMPAYIRLLSYFSNFILLASFLGIGVGCLLAPRARAAVRLVSDPRRLCRGGRVLFPARSRDPAEWKHLFHERHVRTGRARREHDPSAAALHRRRGAVCHARSADGSRDGRAAAAHGLPGQPRRQPRGRRCVWRDVVARARRRRSGSAWRSSRRCRCCDRPIRRDRVAERRRASP